LDQASSSVLKNIQRRHGWPIQLNGQEWRSVVANGRRELLQLATDYTRQYCDLDNAIAKDADAPMILSGHQPQLFHVGVWFKNFVLDQLARRSRAIAINLIIDNDLSAVAAIRVPGGTVEEPFVETVAYDLGANEIPFEERAILDREKFNTFADRVVQTIGPLVANPVVRTWWPRAIAIAQRETNLGRCIAQARHQLEREWGLRTLEVPWSTVCETDTFRHFVLHLLNDLPQLHRVYNESLLEYRHINRIRSRSHPVPELETNDDWLETPLWVWTSQDPRRRRLFARRSGDSIELADSGKNRWLLNPQPAGGLTDLAQRMNAGVKIRPRALVTTMYARLVLSDLFVHGIGGGKYDQLTDAIIHRWLRIDPPQFQVVTATAKLPIARPEVSVREMRDVEWLLRDLRFNPDRHLSQGGSASALIAEKRQWLAMDTVDGNGRQRHVAIDRINKALQSYVQELRSTTEDRRARLEELLQRERLLGSREFSFCLFPERTLRALLLDNV
jgi:hypothetical protein